MAVYRSSSGGVAICYLWMTLFTSTRVTLLKITYHGQHGFDIAVNRVSPR